MKALRNIGLGLVFFGAAGTLVLGSYNSMFVNNDTFMNKTAGIKFTKRLDEINGKVVIGRMAASSSPWTALNKKATKKVEKTNKAIAKKKFKKAEKKLAKAVKKIAKVKLPEPAIKGDFELNLTNVFHKKPLESGTFSGSAKTVDGVIEEIYVNLPNGKTIDINTRERMMGNVFQYEDSETREMKSGMFYEVKKGTYMITLTNDSKFKGTRLEFKANETEVAYNDDYYSSQESWEMDRQNEEAQLAQEEREYTQPSQVDSSAEEYAQNGEAYGFNFKG